MFPFFYFTEVLVLMLMLMLRVFTEAHFRFFIICDHEFHFFIENVVFRLMLVFPQTLVSLRHTTKGLL